MVYENNFHKLFSKTFHASTLPLCSLSLSPNEPLFSPSHPPYPSSPSQKSPSPLVFFSQTPTPSQFGYRLGIGANLRPTWARDGYDRHGLAMVAMGCSCRGLWFAVGGCLGATAQRWRQLDLGVGFA